MKFRPCIDIHNGKVKQIVGGSLRDEGDQAGTNFSSELDAAWYAGLYRRDQLKGGHIIILNAACSSYFEVSKKQALSALHAYPGGMQLGGGVTAENAKEYLEAGASHVIVTSYVFRNGRIDWDRLERLVHAVGREHLVLDLSCRKKEETYRIVTDRWQHFTDEELTESLLDSLADHCDEFLVHGVDVEGKRAGCELDLIRLLAAWRRKPITYAGGIASLQELAAFESLSQGKIDFTIGSALDLFGGTIPYAQISEYK